MQAIVVHMLSGSPTKGIRYKAQCHAGHATIDYPYDVNHADRRWCAAKALILKMAAEDEASGAIERSWWRDCEWHEHDIPGDRTVFAPSPISDTARSGMAHLAQKPRRIE